MAVQEARQYGEHATACAGCAHCGQAGHRRAVAAFLRAHDATVPAKEPRLSEEVRG
ncbi:hypothetical protein R6L23_21070 [Streptomyces sp. SR27]|uniref:hypothetical protein n=1 Tax=Streptomyces sp. SR27 TaxID=3076630 RepID=UPI00295AD263|nr:hypothetical protein [Streptomyces sp. SR27]MDV9190674.1 hypothetical protein [Streptomyces sp. SR27]